LKRPEAGDLIDAAGITTNYHHAGDGAPVVLIHGSGPGASAHATWRQCIPALATDYRVLAPDLLGFGLTERPPGLACNLAAWLDHLVGFLDAVQVRRASLVGYSLGGALAIALAARRPERVDGLVLVGSAGLSFPVTEGLTTVWGYRPGIATMRRLLETLAHDRELVTDEVVETRYRASVEPGVHEAFARLFPAPYQRWVDAVATPEPRIGAIPHRTLIVHGREDRVVPLQTAYRLLHLIPRSQLHVFGGCGHWVPVERADDLNLLLRGFLARPGGGSR
jgi:pimeloyl-ACP methyl ester carboxylesterase